MNGYKRLTSIVGLMFWLTYAALAHANESLPETLKMLATTNTHPYLKQADISDQQQAIQTLYELNQYQLVWLNNDLGNSQVDEVLHLLASAENHGLNPQNYDTTHLAQQWQLLKTSHVHMPERLALYDSALNIALLRYLSDLHSGRIRAQYAQLKPDIHAEKLNLDELILAASAHRHPAELIAKTEPALAVYNHLKQALTHYRKLAQEHNFLPFMFTKTLRPGQNHPQMTELRQFLVTVGDMEQADESETSVYNKATVNGIKKFQTRHGLQVDGIIGEQTAAALNVPLAHRVKQIELAMERLRWLPMPKEGQLIIVNIPAFQLWAYDGISLEQAPPLNMKVIVGESLDKQTPVFMANMQFLQFRPYWNVPTSIAKKELLPKLLNNPSFLTQEHMELVNRFGPNAIRYPVNNETLALLSQGRLKIRQTPGKWNALGSVKFIFPNNYNVYLHDTPTPNLFKRARRDFSHGCIRVENPVALAEFVLQSKGGWDQEKIIEAMRRENPKRVQLKTPIPVLIYYSTAMATNDSVLFFNDIYGLDDMLIQALSSSQKKQMPTALNALPSNPPADELINDD